MVKVHFDNNHPATEQHGEYKEVDLDRLISASHEAWCVPCPLSLSAIAVFLSFLSFCSSNVITQMALRNIWPKDFEVIETSCQRTAVESWPAGSHWHIYRHVD